MTATSDEILVHCKGLTKVYDELTALDHLDLEIPRGHVFGYIGHNGAGKTTTIRILAGLMKQSSGTASIAGVDVSGGRHRLKYLVGYMPDSFGVYDQMRVWEYLDFFGAAFKIQRKERRKRIDFVLDLAEAEYMRDRFVDTLSRGMKQRVGIARTLMHDPKVLLLDEPASGLDPQSRIHMRLMLRHLAENGKTLLISSHILPELAAICDSIGIIHQGRLRVSGPIDKVLSELQRDRLMELRVLTDIAPCQKVIDQHTNCTKVEDKELQPGFLKFRFKDDDTQLANLLSELMSTGAKIVTLREVPLSLEDAYITISGIEGEKDEQEEEAIAGGDEEASA